MQIQVRDLYKQKRSLETEWAVHQRDNQRYTLDMVRIDNKIKEVVKKSAQKANRNLFSCKLHKHSDKQVGIIGLVRKFLHINNFVKT